MRIKDLRTWPVSVLLVAFFGMATLTGCSSTEEEAQEDTTNCDQAFTSEERQECLEKL